MPRRAEGSASLRTGWAQARPRQALVRQGSEGVGPCEPPAGSHAVLASRTIARASWGLLGRWPVPDAARASLRPPACPTGSPALELPLRRAQPTAVDPPPPAVADGFGLRLGEPAIAVASTHFAGAATKL